MAKGHPGPENCTSGSLMRFTLILVACGGVIIKVGQNPDCLMRLPSFAVPLTAFIAGMAGGLTSRFIPFDNSHRQSAPIRTTRLELVDDGGTTVAFLGANSLHQTELAFLDGQHQERAKFGLWSDTPILQLNGENGRELVAFDLRGQKPTIILRDEDRVRVRIGFVRGDVADPHPQDGEYSIVFYAPHTFGKALAAMGIQLYAWDGRVAGGFADVLDKDGHQWAVPKP